MQPCQALAQVTEEHQLQLVHHKEHTTQALHVTADTVDQVMYVMLGVTKVLIHTTQAVSLQTQQFQETLVKVVGEQTKVTARQVLKQHIIVALHVIQVIVRMEQLVTMYVQLLHIPIHQLISLQTLR